MSRVLDALKQAEIANITGSSQDRVAPRLASSLRKVALRESKQIPQPDSPAPILFRVPTTGNPPLVAPSNQPAPDESVAAMQLMDAIQETVNQASIEETAAAKSYSDPPPATRPSATPGEREIANELADNRRAEPYLCLIEAIRRDTAGLAHPLVAIISIDDDPLTAATVARVANLQSRQQRVLVIDGHRSAELTRLYGAAAKAGLCETSQAAIDLLPHASAAFTDFSGDQVRQLAAGYDVALIDAGPNDDSGSLQACRLADVVYVAIRLGQTTADKAIECVKRWRAMGIKLAGSIVIGPH